MWTLGFPGADDLANMYDFNVRYTHFVGNCDRKAAEKPNPELLNIRAPAEAHKDGLLSVAPEEEEYKEELILLHIERLWKRSGN